MKELIYKTIVDTGNISYSKLLKKTGVSEDELKEIIKNLKLDGDILEVDNKYMPFPDDCYLGTVVTSTSLRKYIEWNDNKIWIASNFYYDVIVGDLVCFRLNEYGNAEVVSVVNRSLSEMTCEVVSKDGKLEIIPYHFGMSVNLDDEVKKNLVDGDIILVSIPSGDVGDFYENKLIKKIGRRDDPFIQDAFIALNYGFSNDYTDEYLEEIKKMPNDVRDTDLKGRFDFRNQKCFTIDGKYTKDMDDAVYAERLDDDIIRVYVHIADVSHYVKKDSLVYKRACDMGTSLYMNNSVYHMIYYKFSNGICSLNPNVDRLAKTVIMDIDSNGNVINYNIVKSVINSKKKMAYEDVDVFLTGNGIPLGYEDFTSELGVLNEVSVRLNRKYKKNGKIEFANEELNIDYNDDGSIKTINKPFDSKSGKIIENLMICANEMVANWLLYLGIPAIYRVHELPEAKKINALIAKLNKQGYNIKYVTDVSSPESMQIILEKLSNYDGFDTLSQLFVMTMKKARYSTVNLGHYALSLPAYLHFTSPIRRLPDLVVHMMCDIVLEDYDCIESINFDELDKEINDLAIKSSVRERLADCAEKEAKRRLIIEKLDTLVGEELEGTICELGKKIKIKVFGINTYVDCCELPNNFIFDHKKKQYYDINSDEYLYIGAKVMVKLADVNKLTSRFDIDVLDAIKRETSNKVDVKKKKLVI